VSVSYYYERPDQKALSELERVVHSLAEELAGWRRRTLKAEGELQQARANGGVLAGPELTQARQRVVELETENQSLRLRIDAAKERLRTLSGRVSFLEQHGGGTAA
jgi:FtsZ-binding cell division protein ZapB